MTSNPRAAYLAAGVGTAGPERLLVMLCDRLHLDVRRAAEAQSAGLHDQARLHLMHAQDIVLELRSGLQVDAWEGGPGLASLYAWLTQQLVRANVDRDPAVTAHCLELTAELAATWRAAADNNVAIGA